MSRHCIKHTHVDKQQQSWCGRSVVMEWVFQDLDHATYSVQQGTTPQPCGDCLQVVLEILTPAAQD
jgi:cytidine deaminase